MVVEWEAQGAGETVPEAVGVAAGGGRSDARGLPNWREEDLGAERVDSSVVVVAGMGMEVVGGEKGEKVDEGVEACPLVRGVGEGAAARALRTATSLASEREVGGSDPSQLHLLPSLCKHHATSEPRRRRREANEEGGRQLTGNALQNLLVNSIDQLLSDYELLLDDESVPGLSNGSGLLGREVLDDLRSLGVGDQALGSEDEGVKVDEGEDGGNGRG